MKDVDTTGGVPVVVVPCFNEALRLDKPSFLELARSGRLRLLFVDDGSTDETPEVLRRLAKESDALEVLNLPTNAGKARPCAWGCDVPSTTGWVWSGTATPISPLPPGNCSVWSNGSSPTLGWRRYSARESPGWGAASSERRSVAPRATFTATLASVALGMTVYDTQCGAKVFRVGPELVHALEEPFPSGWVFDVVLCDRLRRGRGVCRSAGRGVLRAASRGVARRAWFEAEPLRDVASRRGCRRDRPGALSARNLRSGGRS